MHIPLSCKTYAEEEIAEVLDSLRSGAVTMGDKCLAFESAFAEYVEARHAIFLNSGSSANLLAWFALANPIWREPFNSGFEVIVPAISWSTTIWPIVQAGGTPVLVDCNPETLGIETSAVEAAISPRTVAVCPVHPLGNVCDMDRLMKICDEHKIILVEDTCESLGSRYRGWLAGRFGLMGTYSFYFSHHMTTIEGGMIVTDDDDLAQLLRMLRSHGWARERKSATEMPFDKRYHFLTTGFNLRPTELNAAFGLHQLKKLSDFNKHRVEKTTALLHLLAPLLEGQFLSSMKIEENVEAVFFGFPVLCRSHEDRDALVNHLEERDIETRPIICGNMARQPGLKRAPHKIIGTLTGADQVMDKGLYWGMHPSFSHAEIEYIANSLKSFPWQ